MSYSVNESGPSQEVAEKLAEQLSKIVCAEPEETLKNMAASVISTALEAMPQDALVQVSLNGSQATDHDSEGDETGTFRNTLNLTIKPIFA
jgi:hypothetical protein